MPRAEAPYDVLLFDLGGVIVELGGLPVPRGFPDDTDEAAIWNAWLRSQAVRRFESGRSQPAEFASELVEEFGLTIAADEFLRHFETWPRGVYPGVPEILASLRPRFRLGCLSNCNQLHWPRFLSEMGLRDAFDHRFSSHELGALKPDREIFERVVAELGCAPERVLFLDDNLVNVEGARAAGLHAVMVKGPAGIRAGLAEIGIETDVK